MFKRNGNPKPPWTRQKYEFMQIIVEKSYPLVLFCLVGAFLAGMLVMGVNYSDDKNGSDIIIQSVLTMMASVIGAVVMYIKHLSDPAFNEYKKQFRKRKGKSNGKSTNGSFKPKTQEERSLPSNGVAG
jgi:hypothetical protein